MILIIHYIVYRVPVLAHPVLLSLSRGKRLYHSMRLLIRDYPNPELQTVLNLVCRQLSKFSYNRRLDNTESNAYYISYEYSRVAGSEQPNILNLLRWQPIRARYDRIVSGARAGRAEWYIMIRVAWRIDRSGQDAA